MRSYLRTVFLLVTIVAIFAGGNSEVLAGAVSSMPRPEDVKFRWPLNTVRVGVSSSFFQDPANVRPGSDIAGALSRSFKAWEAASGIDIEWQIVEKQSVSPAGAAGDGISLITIAGTAENVTFFSRPASTKSAEAARTRVFYNRRSHITEADIALSPFEQFSTDGSFGTFDLESVLTHEIGHMLGLGHTFAAGSIMSERQQKNGSLGLQMLAHRGLSPADIAAVRDLYDYADASDECCVTFTGKIFDQAHNLAVSTDVWAENVATGQLAGYSAVGTDGSFRLGGLPKGDYELFARPNDLIGPAVRIHSVEDASGAIKLEPVQLSGVSEGLSVEHIGLAGQLTDSPVVLRSGDEYTLLLGGTGLGDDVLVSFSSIKIRTAGHPRPRSDLGGSSSAISIDVRVDPEVVPGVYSVYVTKGGADAAFVGAVVIRKPI
jgi:hypothetical protein